MTELSLLALVRAVLDRADGTAWAVREGEPWSHVEPAGAPRRLQGWKLHVSATRLSAPEVLHRVAEILVRHECAFKFARSLETVAELTSDRTDRAQCGKVITAYPRDDDHLRLLAGELDEATAGLPGPAILSDRPVRPGSLVHLRYGAFDGTRVLTNDGSFEVMLRTPDGTTVRDVRNPWFSPPAWAEFPLPESALPGGTQPAARSREAAASRRAPVRLRERYTVREAIRHTARGGVYRALDEQTGAQVIVKQARAHVGMGLPAGDARECLRREFASLTALGDLACAPVDFFEQSGRAFLVTSLVPGVPLARWVHEQWSDTRDGIGPDRLRELAVRLADLLSRVHARGLVYQDFTPNNIMLRPDGGLTLIDAEHCVAPGTVALRAFTPGYGPPEQVGEPRVAPALGPSTDLYALGAVLCYAATGFSPGLLPDVPATRPVHDRIALLLSAASRTSPAARDMAPAILGLTRNAPEERWSLDRLSRFLAGPRPDAAPCTGGAAETGAESGAGSAPCPAGGHAKPTDAEARSTALWGDDARRRLVEDGLSFLVTSMRPPGDDGERLWSSGPFGRTTDPCNVQHGAAGVLAVLVRADRALGGTGRTGHPSSAQDGPAHPGPRVDRAALRAAVARAAGWIDARRTEVPLLLPGLYFGRAGTAWALFDAAEHLGDQEMAARASRLALSLPVRWPNPDVCHGAAGAGLAQLHLWRKTGREEFLDRVVACADGLAAAVERDGGRVFWPVPEDFDSAMAGMRHFGFAHGVAGVAAFLLAAGRATGRQEYLDLAAEAGDTLVAEAERGPWGARWRDGRDNAPGQGMLYHWCSGASGIGTFLLRLWRVTGTPAHRLLAEEAGAAVRHSRFLSPAAACHGLAGNGEFLLDLAAEFGGPWDAWADDLAAVLHSRHALADGRMVLPDESGADVRADHQTGMAGCVGFLLRLGHGGPRAWMAEDGPDRPATAARDAGDAAAVRVPSAGTLQPVDAA